MKATRTVKARKSTGSRGCSESDQEQVCSYTIVVAVVAAVMFVAVDVIVVFVVFLILSGQNEVYLA